MTEDQPYIGQQLSELVKTGEDTNWCYGKYYICKDKTGHRYLRNDGVFKVGMQRSPIDLDGGTYFLTQQDAQDCLDRYNATKDDSNTDTQT